MHYRRIAVDYYPEEDKWLDAYFLKDVSPDDPRRAERPKVEKLKGTFPRKTRTRKNKKFRFRACHLVAKWPHCYWCGKSLLPEEATIEHIVRQADGGSNKPENIAMSCARYNSGRHGGL